MKWSQVFTLQSLVLSAPHMPVWFSLLLAVLTLAMSFWAQRRGE